MQVVDPLQLCPECEVVRTSRARHCGVCNRCVERYDHHCPWINNCVGSNNHNTFLIFVYLLTITIVTLLIQTCIELSIVNGMTDQQFRSTARLYEFMPPDIVEEKVIYQVFSWLIIFTAVFFMLVILALVFIQSRNFCANRTTSERFSRKKPPTRRDSRVASESTRSVTESIDSTGSSLAGSEQCDPRHAEDIIREHGEVPDFTGRSCVTIRNIT